MDKHNPYYNQAESGKQDISEATSGILVSVFLLLFGFFAVLITLSEGKDIRAGAVMDGISATFQKIPKLEGELVDPKKLKILVQDEMVEEIRDLLKDKDFEEEKQRTEFGEAIRFKIPVENYFAINSKEPKESFMDLSQRLVDFVNLAQVQQIRKIEVLFGVGEGRAARNADPLDKFLALQRINEVANLLNNAGLEDDYMGLGVAPVKSSDVVITMLVIYGAE